MTFSQFARPRAVPKRGPRIRIFNVKYSPNLGDGLLSECLERALIDCGADPDTWSIDLAARTSYGAGSQARALQMQLLDSLPRSVRSIAVRAPLALQSRRLWAPHYARSLEGAECVVLGGGNLIADLDLNFPTKISLALSAASWRRLPVFIYGCGVSEDWSPQGRALLEGALRRGAVRKVWVRDERSRTIWDDLVGNNAGIKAQLVRDPGLLAAERYEIAKRDTHRSARPIGLNLMSPLAVRYHSRKAPSASELDSWYLDFARILLEKGFFLAVFSNGSPEDREYARKLRPRLEALLPRGRISFPEPDSPAALTALIAECGAIAAFRMHAIIAAYSCGISFLALSWDAKLESFVRSVNLPDRLFAPVVGSPSAAVRKLIHATEQGVSSNERAAVLAEARRGVEDLYSEIMAEVA